MRSRSRPTTSSAVCRATALSLLFLLLPLIIACTAGDARQPAGSATVDGPTTPGVALLESADGATSFTAPDPDRALQHIRVLAVEIGSRVSTTEEERRAAEYIAGQLEAAGYRVEIETFEVEFTRDESTVTLPGGVELTSARALEGSPDGQAAGRLVLAALGRPSDLADVDAEGAVLLLDRGLITFAEKALNAEAAGAVAVIVVNNARGPLLLGSLGTATVTIPVVGVSADDGARLDGIAAGADPVTVRADRRVVTALSQNVVGRVSERCEAYLGAHYDSVETGPGANDNASGTAALLELARTHRVDGLCAIAFGSEESGLWGSQAFVREHDVGEALFMLNLDMLGSIRSPMFVATVGDAASQALANRASAAAAEVGVRMPRGTFPPFASSDHVSFSAAGVPAITVHNGDDPLMHTPDDDFDNISPDDLATLLRAVAAVLAMLIDG